MLLFLDGSTLVATLACFSYWWWLFLTSTKINPISFTVACSFVYCASLLICINEKKIYKNRDSATSREREKQSEWIQKKKIHHNIGDVVSKFVRVHKCTCINYVTFKSKAILLNWLRSNEILEPIFAFQLGTNTLTDTLTFNNAQIKCNKIESERMKKSVIARKSLSLSQTKHILFWWNFIWILLDENRINQNDFFHV